MPIVPTQEILARAFRDRYGVAAINIVNDLSLEAVLAAAQEMRAPLIVQTSVKTVRMYGAPVLFSMWQAMTRNITVPVALHLDHCPEREVISTCLAQGWNSVLFDASSLIPLQQMVERVERGDYRAVPVRVFPFRELPEAHRLMESNEAAGKLVAVIN